MHSFTFANDRKSVIFTTKSLVADVGILGGLSMFIIVFTDSRSSPRAMAKRTYFFLYGVPGGVVLIFRDLLHLTGSFNKNSK